MTDNFPEVRAALDAVPQPAIRPVDLAASGVTIGVSYPAPVVAHDAARLRTLERYAVVKARAA